MASMSLKSDFLDPAHGHLHLVDPVPTQRERKGPACAQQTTVHTLEERMAQKLAGAGPVLRILLQAENVRRRCEDTSPRRSMHCRGNTYQRSTKLQSSGENSFGSSLGGSFFVTCVTMALWRRANSQTSAQPSTPNAATVYVYTIKRLTSTPS